MRRLVALLFLALLSLTPLQGAHAARQPVLGNAPSIFHTAWGHPFKTMHYPSNMAEEYGHCAGTTFPVHAVSYVDNRAEIIATYRCDTKREQDWEILAQRFLPADAIFEADVTMSGQSVPIYDSPSLGQAIPPSLCKGPATDRGLLMLAYLHIQNHDVWMAGMVACLAPTISGQ